MSDAVPTTSLTCDHDQVNMDGGCKSEDPAAGVMFCTCLLMLGHTAEQSAGQESCHAVRNASLARAPPRAPDYCF